jgi:hypothetical protein
MILDASAIDGVSPLLKAVPKTTARNLEVHLILTYSI